MNKVTLSDIDSLASSMDHRIDDHRYVASWRCDDGFCSRLNPFDIIDIISFDQPLWVVPWLLGLHTSQFGFSDD